MDKWVEMSQVGAGGTVAYLRLCVFGNLVQTALHSLSRSNHTVGSSALMHLWIDRSVVERLSLETSLQRDEICSQSSGLREVYGCSLQRDEVCSRL